MKNIQVIDGAENCSYDIFSADENEFKHVFPDDNQDIEFVEDVYKRLGYEKAAKVLASIWSRRIDKSKASGIHGTLFCDLERKRRFYPTKRENEAVANPANF